jgi:hypothetical protein
MAERRWGRNVALIVFLTIWGVLGTVVAASMTAWHSVAIPVYAKAVSAPGSATQPWQIRHFLSGDCPCSRSVAVHLVDRGVIPGADEQVILIDGVDRRASDALAEQLQRRGFRIETITAAEATSREGIVGVPVLEIARDGEIVYRGGYDDSGMRKTFRDAEIFAALAVHQTVTRLPVLGCAVSDRFRTKTDPLGIKQFFTRLESR